MANWPFRMTNRIKICLFLMFVGVRPPLTKWHTMSMLLWIPRARFSNGIWPQESVFHLSKHLRHWILSSTVSTTTRMPAILPYAAQNPWFGCTTTRHKNWFPVFLAKKPILLDTLPVYTLANSKKTTPMCCWPVAGITKCWFGIYAPRSLRDAYWTL